MSHVDESIVFAAAEALTEHPFLGGLDLTGWEKTVATVVLEAAQPMILKRVAAAMMLEADAGAKSGLDRIAMRAFAANLAGQ